MEFTVASLATLVNLFIVRYAQRIGKAIMAMLLILVSVIFIRIVFWLRARQGGFDRAAIFSMVITEFRPLRDFMGASWTLAKEFWWWADTIFLNRITSSLSLQAASRALFQ